MRSQKLQSNHVRALLIMVIAFFGRPALAQELTYLPLQGPGQASIAIDHAKKVAFIIDLGKDRGGDQVLIDNMPLLDKLADLGMQDLVFSCSHPHADHMGGIRALFSNHRLFFQDGDVSKPKFKSITVIDDIPDATKSLYALLSEWPETSIKSKHVNARNENAFAKLSNSQDEVFIENIVYETTEKAGPHGRAVVTRIVLGQKQSIVDFDDADSATIRKVVDALKSRGVTKINSFVVPHHGSSYHDIEPILELKPDRALITVNPRNRYGHPGPANLLTLMKELGPQNVLITGSVDPIVLDPTGVKSARHTAAMRDSYALFVLPNRLRAEKRGITKDVDMYEEIHSIMFRDPGAPPPHSGPSPKPPTNPSAGGSGSAIMERRVNRSGSMHSQAFEIGLIVVGEKNQAALQQHKIFSQPSDLERKALLVTLERGGEDDGETVTKLNRDEAQNAEKQLALWGKATNQSQNVEINFDTEAGFDNGVEPEQVIARNELQAVAHSSPVRPVSTARRTPRSRAKSRPPRQPRPPVAQLSAAKRPSVPDGGMVFLKGDRLFPVGQASELLGGTLDLCGTAYCVKSAQKDGDADTAYLLPFSPGPLFSEVWTRVADQGIDAFYLSINPTKQFLRDLSQRLEQVPSDKLEYGAGDPGIGIRSHEVVTAGNIEKSQIGQILWEADVAFKSAALGFNVLAGMQTRQTSAAAFSLAQQEQANPKDLGVEYRDRWCRLYWASGQQNMSVDQRSNKVSLTGNAVVAHSTPMELRDGALKDVPQGSWCSDTKLLAARLQKQVNLGNAEPPFLNQLKRLAEMQSFIRWARDNGLEISDQFRKSISDQKAPTSFEVPRWTSGIRTNPMTLIQEEYYQKAGIPTHLVHVSMADSSIDSKCVGPLWDVHPDEFRARGLTYDAIKGKWVGPGASQILNEWMTNLAKSIKECANGVLLPAISVRPQDELDVMSMEESFGVVTHIQPIHMHGGVLLGVQRKFLETAWRDKGLLISPSRRILFKRVNDDLHFWNVIDNYPTFGSLGQHVAIKGGSVTDASAYNGRLRFVIETQPGGSHPTRVARAASR
jgi:beta-lactamase superfamily II metal-dependent hydrolase